MLSRIAAGLPGDFFRGSSCYYFSTKLATLRAEVDYPVCTLDDIQVMLYDNHSVTVATQSEEDLYQLMYIG